MKLANAFTSMMLAMFSIDLLYLFAIGAWQDSNQVVEMAEVILLMVFVALGIAVAVWNIKRLP